MSAFLSDNVVNLRPVTRADLPQLAAWRNDPELRARTREFRPLTDVDQERWLAKISGADRRDFMFVVERVLPIPCGRLGPGSHYFQPDADRCDCGLFGPNETSTERQLQAAVGVVGLCHWDQVNASAEVSFYIGDTRARRQGYTKAALQLLHAYGFQELGLHRIWAECYQFNLAGQKVLRALGYTQVGIQRETMRHNGEWASSIFYDLLEDEWRARS